MAPCCYTNRKTVLMTGFKAFLNYETNPSWEGVKAMNGSEIEKKYNICLFREEIEVSYNGVDKHVPGLLKTLQPHLTIHVGLSEPVPCFVLETQANNRNFHSDENMISPKEPGPIKTLVTQLDVADICRKFNSDREDKLYAKISSNADRYLCEYIYYTSLHHGRSPTLFVHVPLKKYSDDQLAKGLERILELCLQQLYNQEVRSLDCVLLSKSKL